MRKTMCECTSEPTSMDGGLCRPKETEISRPQPLHKREFKKGLVLNQAIYDYI